MSNLKRRVCAPICKQMFFQYVYNLRCAAGVRVYRVSKVVVCHAALGVHVYVLQAVLLRMSNQRFAKLP